MRPALLFFLRFSIGVFLLFAAANLCAQHFHFRWHQVPNHGYLQVVHDFQQNDSPADLVFFGTSAMRNAIVPLVVKEHLQQQLKRPVEVWNLALPGATPEIARFYVDHIFKDHPPRIFVIEAAPFLWDADRKNHPDSEVYWRWFASWSDLLCRFRTMRRQDLPDAIHGRAWGAEALWLQSGLLGHHFSTGPHPAQPWGGVYAPEDLQKQPQKLSVQKQPGMREGLRVGSYALSDVWRQDLQHIAEVCARENTQLILLHPPFYPALRPLFAEGAYETYLDWMQENANQLQVPFLNLQSTIRLQPSMYRDFIHYAPTGANWFSQYVCNLLLPYLNQP